MWMWRRRWMMMLAGRLGRTTSFVGLLPFWAFRGCGGDEDWGWGIVVMFLAGSRVVCHVRSDVSRRHHTHTKILGIRAMLQLVILPTLIQYLIIFTLLIISLSSSLRHQAHCWLIIKVKCQEKIRLQLDRFGRLFVFLGAKQNHCRQSFDNLVIPTHLNH